MGLNQPWFISSADRLVISSMLKLSLEKRGLNYKPTYMYMYIKKKMLPWISLVVQWLRICLPMQRTQVQSLAGELRSHMLRSN